MWSASLSCAREKGSSTPNCAPRAKRRSDHLHRLRLGGAHRGQDARLAELHELHARHALRPVVRQRVRCLVCKDHRKP